MRNDRQLQQTQASLTEQQRKLDQAQKASKLLEQQIGAGKAAQDKLAQSEAAVLAAKMLVSELEAKGKTLSSQLATAREKIAAQTAEIGQLKEDGKRTEDIKARLAAAEAALAQERHMHASTKELVDKGKETIASLEAQAHGFQEQMAALRQALAQERADMAELQEKLDLLSSEMEAKNRKMRLLEGADRSELELLLLGEVHQMQMTLDALRRSSAASIKVRVPSSRMRWCVCTCACT